MVAISLDKINYNKVSKYANVLIFKDFYPKTKNRITLNCFMPFVVKLQVEKITFWVESKI